jgi:hypothetical protein
MILVAATTPMNQETRQLQVLLHGADASSHLDLALKNTENRPKEHSSKCRLVTART